MTNRPKKIGTGFETAVCRYLRERLQDDRIERRALHGSKDCGDIYGLYAHGFDGIAECKAHKSWNQPARLAEWREQTLAERACFRLKAFAHRSYPAPFPSASFACIFVPVWMNSLTLASQS